MPSLGSRPTQGHPALTHGVPLSFPHLTLEACYFSNSIFRPSSTSPAVIL